LPGIWAGIFFLDEMSPDGAAERQVTASHTEKARETPRAPGSPLDGPRDRERIRTVVLRDHDDVALLVADRGLKPTLWRAVSQRLVRTLGVVVSDPLIERLLGCP